MVSSSCDKPATVYVSIPVWDAVARLAMFSGCQADLSEALKVQFNGEEVARWMKSVVKLAHIRKYFLWPLMESLQFGRTWGCSWS